MAYSKPPVDVSRPHPARVHDFLLGGRDNYLADRRAAGELPARAARAARQDRAFMHRAVGWLASIGIDQYLDVGSGIPTEPNLHQIVQRVNPACRVVYTDRDPLVLWHAAAHLISAPQGATDYLRADLRDPAALLARARELLDFGRPLALSLIALLHFLPDQDDPHGLVRALVGALPSGSYVALSHGTPPAAPKAADGAEAARAAASYRRHVIPYGRARAETGRFFAGLELVAPGLVAAPLWYKNTPPPEDGTADSLAGVARVP
ncbi:SAM-dependent methyltransferase [Streptomyces sp. NPDC047002]|uniref:SAM-dependent methyltransferase n=1 Tax=Streptomyces sp. NPDC047002 TaxID=3155475 RepID=UPI0034556E3C